MQKLNELVDIIRKIAEEVNLKITIEIKNKDKFEDPAVIVNDDIYIYWDEIDKEYIVYKIINHPGYFNPRDGGTPPETEEIEIACNDNMLIITQEILLAVVKENIKIAVDNMLWDILQRNNNEYC